MILGAIPGATPDKWVARWRSRYPDLPLQVHYYDDDPDSALDAQLARLRAGTVDVGYIRMPEAAQEIDKGLYHRVLLYREEAVVSAAADHWIAAAESSVTAAEIAEETQFHPADMLVEGAGPDSHTPQAGADLGRAERLALETAATGAGVVVLPASVARMLARKDVAIRTVEGLPGYQTGLAWLVEQDSDLIQEFIGVARGRRPGSGRSAVPGTDDAPANPRNSSGSRKQNSGKQGSSAGAGRGTRPGARGRSRTGAPKSGSRSRRGRR